MRSLLAFVVLASVTQAALAQTRWEYKAVSRSEVEALAGKDDKNRLEAGLNRLGSGGWELTAVESPLPLGEGKHKPGHYIFKRPAATRKAEAAPEKILKIVALKNAKAADLAKTLSAVFGKADGLAVATDDRTNSLILQGKPEKLLEVAALIQELEERTDPEKK